MQHTLLWVALVLGGAGWVGLFLLAFARRSATGRALPLRRPFLWLAGLLPLVVWLATLPTRPPFSSGQGWGRGFLLGGVVAFASALIMLRASSSPRRAALIFPFGALIIVCLPLLWMRSSIIEALLGAALSWSAVSLVLAGGVEEPQAGGEFDLNRTGSSQTVTALLNGSVFATTLCAVAALGVYRDVAGADVARGTYSSLAVVLAAGVALALLAAVLWEEAATKEASAGARFSGSISTILCLVVPLGAGYWMAMRVLDDLRPLYVVAVGVGLGLLSRVWAAQRKGDEPPSPGVPAAMILVALCGFGFAFQLMQGFGVGLMLLGAWPASLLALPNTSPQRDEEQRRLAQEGEWAHVLTLLGAFLAVLLMSRLFATRFRADLRGAGFADQFALFGFLAGAVLPAFLCSLGFGSSAKSRDISSSSRERAGASLVRLALVGALALALPGAMLGLWGIKVVPAFFAGLALAQCGFVPIASARWSGASALLSLAMASTLSQWAPRLLPLAGASRAQRMHALLWGVGGLLLFLLLVDYGARLGAWLWSRRAGARLEGVSR